MSEGEPNEDGLTVLQRAVRSLAAALKPIAEMLADDELKAELLMELGLTVQAQNVGDPGLDAQIDTLEQYGSSESASVKEFLVTFDALLSVSTALHNVFKDAAETDNVPVNELVHGLLSMCTLSYLQRKTPLFWGIAKALGFFEQDIFGHAWPGWHENRVGEFFSDTGLYFSDRWSGYKNDHEAKLWADGIFFPIGVALMLFEVFRAHGKSDWKMRALYGWDRDPTTPETTSDRLCDRALTLEIKRYAQEVAESILLNFQTVPENHGGPGLLVTVRAQPATYETDRWIVGLSVPIASNAIGFLIGPKPAVLSDVPTPTFGVSVAPKPGAATWKLFSSGTRAELTPGEAKLEYAGTMKGRFGLKASIIVDASDADGFMAEMIGAATVRFDVDLAIGLSKKGMYLEGGGGFSITIPVTKSVGPLTLQQVTLSAGAHTKDGISLEIGTAIALQLGPLTAVVEDMGFQIRYAESGHEFGFKPPKGIGVMVETPAVRGGGYLFFDSAKQEYAGVLELELGELVTVKAIGLLTTPLPGKQEGFSLLLIVSVEGLNLQTGSGFAVNGIGGVLGVMRSINPEPLRDGIKTGSVGKIMFPKDPVANAPALVSALSTIFPVAADRYTFGAMLQVIWGTDRMVRLSLGVILEIPAPVRVVLLGKVEIDAPDPAAPLAKFRLDALGIYDQAAKTISLDATMYDSRVLVYTITGDMAMRASWGEDPHFVLAIGGFNPRFKDLPAKFPKLARAAITFGLGENPRLRSETYLAVTTNSFQAGARTELYAAALGFSVTGFFSWDVLVHFDPFRFWLDFAAGLALKRGSMTLMSVRLAGSLTGFTPLTVSGSATFCILFFDVSFRFDFTLVEGSAPPETTPIDVKQLLTAALTEHRNWTSELPRRYGRLVSLRTLMGAQELVVHPLAKLAVKQAVVPLGVQIARFGQAKPAGETLFEITSAKIGSDGVATSSLQGTFAPGQFFDLSDAEKLTRPSFEKLPAGVRMEGSDQITCGGSLERNLSYETKIVDPAADLAKAAAAYMLLQSKLNVFSKTGAVGKSGPKPVAKGKKVKYTEPQFVVASKTDLKPVGVQPGVKSYSMCKQAMAKAPGGGDLQIVSLEEAVTS